MNSYSKIKIAFIIPSLRAGGAERVMSFLAQNINPNKFDVTLLVIGFKKDSQYDVKGINLVFLNERRVLYAIPKLFIFLRKFKQDVAISAIGHLNTVMAFLSLFFRRTKFIAREVNVNSVLNKHSEGRSNRAFNILSIISKKLFDKIVCQSNDMAEDMITNYKVDKNNIVIINNPISEKFITKKENNGFNNIVIKFITIGRLAKQKGHLRILEALSKLNIPFHYTIIGDGPEKMNIFETISKFELEEHITHIPFTNKVEDFLAKNDIFLQGSFVEGFPNALIESCAVGTPVVAFKAPGGIDEIIIDGVNGYIANSTDDYIEKIKLLSSKLKEIKPSSVSDSVISKYSAIKIIAEYENLFQKIISTNN